ncbi:DUF2637 domain-containing protein [Kitasatospora sp. NPDC003701]
MSEDKRPAPGMSWWDKAAIGAMGGVGGALSYDALQQMAVAMHIRPELTYLFPIAIDGFIAYGTRALVVLKDAPLRARAYTWSVFGSATATSVWANWTHAVRLNDISAPGEGLHLPDWSVGVLSTIAPLVLGGATHLYIVMSRHTSGADAEPQADAGTKELGDTDQTSLQSAPDQDAGAKPAVRTRWWNRKRAAAPEVDNAASATADRHHELSAVPTPSPVSLTKAPEGPAALPAGPAAASGPPPRAVPVPGPQTSVPGSGTAAGDSTVPTPRTVPASGAVPTSGTVPTPGPSGTVPALSAPKPGTVPGTPASRAPESSPVGTVPTVPAAPAPRVHAAPPAVPAAAVPATEPGPGDGAGPVPNLTESSRPGDAAAAGRVSAATATAPHRVPTPAPSPVPSVPTPAQAEAARPRGPGTATAATVLRAVPAPGESAGTGPETRPGPVPARQAGPRSGTEPTPIPAVPAVPAGDRPGPGTVPTINTASGTVPVSRSPVPGTDRGPDRDVRKRQLSDDELEALLPIGRTVAATAEGRLTREALRAGLRAQNVPINNIALGQLLRELKDIEGKPPPSRR